jgi:uncharacterized protein (DUF697 family)
MPGVHLGSPGSAASWHTNTEVLGRSAGNYGNRRVRMTSDQRDKCHAIIHGASVSGAGIAAAMAQAPGTDNIPLTAIEIAMVIALGQVFGISITESGAKSIIAGYLGTIIGRGVFQFAIGWVPFLGNAVNAATAAGVIETLGWAVATDFANRDNR